ncbi:E3 ubiquitin-protein ligase RNF169 [Pristis pectinata]|uniref:E3 ubiquitin-protein ligase RNF169 n=1 Tax=Pristis pectinata TaxID=685728 RepID=UPI00223E399F|nr:E3 ubiquitin-protein ligase RNF169 [Pristis pectinata]
MAAWSGSGARVRRGRQGAGPGQGQAGDTGPAAASLCGGCLSRAIPEAGLGLGLGLGLACPLCRHGDTPGSRPAAALWQRSRRKKQRDPRRQEEAEQRPEPVSGAVDGAWVVAGSWEAEPVFRAPLVLSKAGDVREEFENQLRQYEADESLKEDDETVTAEIIQIILAEGEQEKQQLEKKKLTIAEQVKRDEQLARKWNREFTADNMSDSENEEPVKRVATRQWGLTANGKLSSNCSSHNTRMFGSSSEESRSWSTPVENNQIRKAIPRSDGGTKVPSMTLGTNTLNVLSSSENSRPNSAPDLSTDKRLLADTSASEPVKWERSTSPDSNDSISEELNHFKPIICSPCTPPKKLPDGRLLKPRIIKSTPRNLYSNLQKAVTTYEVSPNVLEKWGQILQDRHKEKTASKGTLTSEEEEDEGVGRPVPECDIPEVEPATASRSHSSPGFGQAESQASPRPMDCSDFAEVPDSVLEDLEWETVECSAGASPLRHRGAEQKENGAHQNPRRQTPAHPRKRSCKGGVSSSSGADCPSSRSHHSRKRHHKTKHTAAEANKRAKLSPAQSAGKVNTALLTDMDRARQEDEDRKLAHRLQRRFDLERTTVNRKKGSKDSYPLRTKVISNAE